MADKDDHAKIPLVTIQHLKGTPKLHKPTFRESNYLCNSQLWMWTPKLQHWALESV